MTDTRENERFNPKVKRITGYIGFEPSPRFFDVRGQLVEAISKRLDEPYWRVEEDELFVWAEDDLWLFNVDDGSLFMSFEDRVKIPHLRASASRIITEVLVRLDAEAAFVGASVVTVTEANSLDALHSWMQDRIGPARASLFDAFGGPPTDTTWQFEIAGGEQVYNLTIGALAADELEGTEEHHFVGNPDNLPDVFLLAEVRNRSIQNPPLAVEATADAWLSTLIATAKASATFHRALSSDDGD